MKVWIDQDLCTGDGLCEEIADEVFFGKDDAPTVAARVVGLERWLNRMLGLAPSDPTILGAHRPWCIHL